MTRDDRLDEDKELKVKLPLSQHVQLHSLKVLTGRNISETVAEALRCHIGDALDDVPVPEWPDRDPGAE